MNDDRKGDFAVVARTALLSVGERELALRIHRTSHLNEFSDAERRRICECLGHCVAKAASHSPWEVARLECAINYFLGDGDGA